MEEDEVRRLLILSRETDNHVGKWIQETIPDADVQKIEEIYAIVSFTRSDYFYRQEEIIRMEQE